jgi:hypothetical protein
MAYSRASVSGSSHLRGRSRVHAVGQRDGALVTPLAADKQEPWLVGRRGRLSARGARGLGNSQPAYASSANQARGSPRRRTAAPTQGQRRRRGGATDGPSSRGRGISPTSPPAAARLRPLAGLGLCDHLNRCCLTRLVQAGRRRVIHREDGSARRAGPRQPRHDHQPRHRFDRLRDRVTLPVKDKTGRLLGFTGRSAPRRQQRSKVRGRCTACTTTAGCSPTTRCPSSSRAPSIASPSPLRPAAPTSGSPPAGRRWAAAATAPPLRSLGSRTAATRGPRRPPAAPGRAAACDSALDRTGSSTTSSPGGRPPFRTRRSFRRPCTPPQAPSSPC